MTTLEERFEQCDSVVKSVVLQFISRSEVGRKKYGTTLDRTDLTETDWLQHAIEECSDMLLYMTRLKQELKRRQEYFDTSLGESSFS